MSTVQSRRPWYAKPTRWYADPANWVIVALIILSVVGHVARQEGAGWLDSFAAWLSSGLLLLGGFILGARFEAVRRS